MKILELDLKRYGPFTDVMLDLSEGEHGLHVVFGRNEAGKSTTLRALTSLLFGIEHATRDAFLHEMSRLRIGGRLRRSTGEELAFVRKKGRTKTILSPDDESPLDEARLAHFLSGVDRNLFRSLYGIGHSDLIEGGKAILEQRGELGQALFSAALGTADLRTLLDDLNGTADALFRPRGQTQTINALIRKHREALKAVKNATLSSDEWTRLQKEIKELDTEFETTKVKLEQRQAEELRLRRVKRVFRPLHTLDAVLEELEELKDTVELPDDFGEQRRTATLKLRTTEEEKTKLGLEAADVREQLEALDVDESLLAEASEVQALSEELGAYKKAKTDLPAQEAKHRQLVNQARDALAAFRPGMTIKEVVELKPKFARRKTIEALADEARELTVEEQSNLKSLRNLKNKLDRLDRTLSEQPPSPDFSGLAATVATARKAGDIDSRVDEIGAKTNDLATTCTLQLKRLGLWSGAPSDFEALPLPLPDTVERFDQSFSLLDDELRHLETRREEHLEERMKTEQALLELQAAGEVPGHEQLEEARRVRTAGWQLVRRAWIDGEDVSADATTYDPGRPLPEAYEVSVENADDVADRMYREVERVEQHHTLSARLGDIDDTLKTIERKIEENREERAAVAADWRELWRPVDIAPLEPREMLTWLRRAETLREKLATLRTVRDDLRRLEHQRNSEREALTTALTSLGIEPPDAGGGEELAPLLSYAEEQLNELQQRLETVRTLKRSMEDAEADFKKATDDQKDLHARRAQWRTAWRDAVSWLELSEEPSPAEVSAALEQLETIFDLLADADKQLRRISGIEHVIEEFEQRVGAFAEKLGASFDGESPAVFINTMVENVNTARKAEERRDTLEERRRSIELKQRRLTADIEAAKTRLDELKKLAAAETDEELDRAEKNSARRRELTRQERELRQQLRDNGDGHPVDRLREEARDTDIDTLPAEIADAERIAGELAAHLEELRVHRAKLAAEERAITGSGTAAEAKEEANRILAQMRLEVERYLRARAAASILEAQIESYRRENQTPLLARAGELFSQLTLGAYKGLRDDLDDRGTPFVLGVRPDDTEVPVDGMSDGTCDQLFLSLRLAALERHLDNTEPMPFVVDDILIGFDDERSRGALEVLAGLASKTQVILFTHHTRVVELATDLRPDAGVFVHEIK